MKMTRKSIGCNLSFLQYLDAAVSCDGVSYRVFGALDADCDVLGGVVVVGDSALVVCV